MFGVDRLGDEVIGSLFHRVDGIFNGTVGADHNDRKLRSLLGQLPKNLNSPHFRHLEIQEHQSRLVFFNLGQSFRTVRDRRNRASHSLQSHAQEPTRGSIIVDDQHARSSRRA